MRGSLSRAPSYRRWIAPKDLRTAGDVPRAVEHAQQRTMQIRQAKTNVHGLSQEPEFVSGGVLCSGRPLDLHTNHGHP